MAKKPRAWSNQRGKLPEPPAESSEWMKKVFAAKDERSAKTLDELAAEYEGLVEEEKFEELARKARNIIYEALERRMLEELEKIEKMSGQDMWRGEPGTVSPKFTPRPNVVDQAALDGWIKEHKLESMLTLPGGRLNSIIAEAYDQDIAASLSPAERAALKAGMPGSLQPPPGVNVFLKNCINFTQRRKPKKADTE